MSCAQVNELIGVASSKAPNPPRHCIGGMLADAMGLGKTVMLLSLILKSKEEDQANQSSFAGENPKQAFKPLARYRTTLVVAPLTLIAQWEDELASKTNLTHKVFYGESARLVAPHSFNGIDVVITTCEFVTLKNAEI